MSTRAARGSSSTSVIRGNRGRGSFRNTRGRGGSTQENSRTNTRPSGGTPRPTHFISLPLDHHAELRAKVATLTSHLTSEYPPIEGLDSSIFIRPARLHMTLGVMTLENPSTSARTMSGSVATDQSVVQSPYKTISEALALLQLLRPEVMNLLQDETNNPGGKLEVPLRGVDIMDTGPRGQKNFNQAHCMWTGPGDKVDSSTLWQVCLLVHQRFKDEGFITETRPLKLHCTLINSSFRQPRRPFSYASTLSCLRRTPALIGLPLSTQNAEFQESNADFGTWSINEIQLCRMGSFDSAGRYVSLGGISLKNEETL